MIRRNLSSRARHLSGGDAIIISIPKSGRTWVRTFLCAYFCKRNGREFTLEPEQYVDLKIPRIIYSHDRFEYRTKGRQWDKLRGKYLIPSKELGQARIILLARDPRDCFVSLYLQMTRRDPATAERLRARSISEVLRDRRFGIRAMVRTMNEWMREFSGRPDFSLLRYESLRAAPVEHFRTLLGLLGEATPDMSILQQTIEFSRFENMQKMEAAGAFDSKILRAGDVLDPESFKVRRGKIGGYREYLSADDQRYAADAIRKLDSQFGYNPQ